MTDTATLPARVTRIEDKIDRTAIGSLAVSRDAGGIEFQNMTEVMEFSKVMAVSDVAIPRHLRGNVGACLAICIQAAEWRMSPYAVANKSYVVNDRVAFESQLIHAVIEQRAPLIGRLKNRYTGEGGKRRCIVWAHVKGEEQPLEFQSSEFDQITPKNSPLWKTKPDLQLYYNASRDWARMYFPDVIMGVYSEDELDDDKIAPGRMTIVADRPRAQQVLEKAKSLAAENQGPHIDTEDQRPADEDPPSDPEEESPGIHVKPEEVADWLKFSNAAFESSKEHCPDPELVEAAIGKLKLTDCASAKRAAGIEARTKYLTAIRAGQFDYTTATIKEG